MLHPFSSPFIILDVGNPLYAPILPSYPDARAIAGRTPFLRPSPSAPQRYFQCNLRQTHSRPPERR